tara:strand:+ start:351 stop:506 length:156 start_codon:yes stop_codon:yes gene_type:complete
MRAALSAQQAGENVGVADDRRYFVNFFVCLILDREGFSAAGRLRLAQQNVC